MEILNLAIRLIRALRYCGDEELIDTVVACVSSGDESELADLLDTYEGE